MNIQSQQILGSKQIVEEFLSYVQEGNFEKVGSYLHPAIKWNQPGDNCFSGLKHSVGEVFQMVGGMLEKSANTLQLSRFHSLAVNGNRVASVLHWKATHPQGAQLEVVNIDVYTIEDGKIAEVTVYTEDPQQEDAFWGN